MVAGAGIGRSMLQLELLRREECYPAECGRWRTGRDRSIQQRAGRSRRAEVAGPGGVAPMVLPQGRGRRVASRGGRWCRGRERRIWGRLRRTWRTAAPPAPPVVAFAVAPDVVFVAVVAVAAVVVAAVALVVVSAADAASAALVAAAVAVVAASAAANSPWGTLTQRPLPSRPPPLKPLPREQLPRGSSPCGSLAERGPRMELRHRCTRQPRCCTC